MRLEADEKCPDTRRFWASAEAYMGSTSHKRAKKEQSRWAFCNNPKKNKKGKGGKKDTEAKPTIIHLSSQFEFEVDPHDDNAQNAEQKREEKEEVVEQTDDAEDHSQQDGQGRRRRQPRSRRRNLSVSMYLRRDSDYSEYVLWRAPKPRQMWNRMVSAYYLRYCMIFRAT